LALWQWQIVVETLVADAKACSPSCMPKKKLAAMAVD
jgi:hypothetical protein